MEKKYIWGKNSRENINLGKFSKCCLTAITQECCEQY